MGNWKCPIEYIDEDVRETVRIMNECGMRTYQSCSGSYKDHKGKSTIVEAGCVEMLDSDMARDFIALLVSDKRWKCSISKEKECEFYGNQLPTGFRFKIDFENICGDEIKDLQLVLESVVQGKKATAEDRKKIDAVCELIDTFDVSRGNSITYSFNDEMIDSTKNGQDNYSITIRDNKDFADLKENLGESVDGFIQDQHESKFLGKDFLTMLAVLKKIGIEYPKVPTLKQGQKARSVENKSRVNKFLMLYAEKTEIAKAKLEEEQNTKMFESLQEFDFEDLLGLVKNKDSNDDEAR